MQLIGNFKIHGGTHEITLTMPVTRKGNSVEGHARFIVPYEGWGMKNPSTLFLKVEKTVALSISAIGEVQDNPASH